MVWLLSAGVCLSAEPENPPAAGEREPVYLYFTDPGGRYLTPEIRTLEHPGDIPVFCHAVVEALIDGPESPLAPVLDSETRVLGVYVDDANTAYIDLENAAGIPPSPGVRTELLSVYSLVNTLVVNIDGIDRVKILIGGSEAETLAGHIATGFPLTAHMLLVR